MCILVLVRKYSFKEKNLKNFRFHSNTSIFSKIIKSFKKLSFQLSPLGYRPPDIIHYSITTTVIKAIRPQLLAQCDIVSCCTVAIVM